MLSKHDELLLRDLKLQPLWLLWFYIFWGLGTTMFALFRLKMSLDAMLCVGGGFLVALGAEKLVSRRIRNAALNRLNDL